MTGPKITFIGAGSTVFAKNPVGDILSYPEPAECRITLHDLDAHWLSTSRKVAERIARTLGRGHWSRASPTGRALDGADYAINMIHTSARKF